MSSNTFAITSLTDPLSLTALADEATADGHRMVVRLLEEWATGENRFERPGERTYVAAVDGQICGICGLNIDPFANDDSVGRVRRLYVSAHFRRRGIGSSIMLELLKDAAGRFCELQLRTHDARASAFYDAVGFMPVRGTECCTHRRIVEPSRGELANA